jgi:F-type H+-transporting ATPase subunit delta
VFAEAASVGALPRVAAELFVLAPLLQREPRLRKTFADIGIPDEAKQGFVRELLEGRVDQHTLSLLESLIARPGLAWRLPAIALDLAIQATLAQAEQDGSLGEVEDQLFRFAGLLEAHSDLRSALSNPALPEESKRAVLDDLLAGRVAPETMTLLRNALAEPGDPVARIQDLADRAAARRNRVVALARTAVPLDADRRDRLAGALGRLAGADVDLEVVVDPRVVGGVVARIGDEVIDGTVRRRLELALEELAG